MKLTINTNILKKHSLSLGEFLILLLGYYDVDIQNCQDSIIKKHLAERNIFKNTDLILSNNNKDLVARILMESDEKAINCGINFNDLAYQLQQLYPEGTKTGTTHSWRGTTEEIAQKLRTLVVKHNFLFTPEEAIAAVKDYISCFDTPNQHTSILKNLILTTVKDNSGEYEVKSQFMTIIENLRSQ